MPWDFFSPFRNEKCHCGCQTFDHSSLWSFLGLQCSYTDGKIGWCDISPKWQYFYKQERGTVCLCEDDLCCIASTRFQVVTWTLFFFFPPFFGVGVHSGGGRLMPLLYEDYDLNRDIVSYKHDICLSWQENWETWNDTVLELRGFISEQGQKHKSKLHGLVWTLFFIKNQCPCLLLDAVLWPYARTKEKQNTFGNCHWSLMSVLSVI